MRHGSFLSGPFNTFIMQVQHCTFMFWRCPDHAWSGAEETCSGHAKETENGETFGQFVSKEKSIAEYG